MPKESVCLPGVGPQSIQAHHTDMCKVEDEDREGYKNISQKRSQWVSSLADAEHAAGAKSQLRCDLGFLEQAKIQQTPGILLGDVIFKEKIDHNHGVVMGHALGTTPDAVRATGSSTKVSWRLFITIADGGNETLTRLELLPQQQSSGKR